MFDIGASELLVLVIVAIVVIGPKDLPLALRTAGRWVAKMRRVSNHFRAGIETMIREAEMEEMERKWKEQNERIMRETAAQETAAAQGQTPAAAEDQNDPFPTPLAADAPHTDPVMTGPMPPEAKVEARVEEAPAARPGSQQP
ncbi:twin-arginine translocation protein TatB [Novosphingobium aromaticivorans DSM 12444]|uniref:Sec-independent protein translocase protein TatB n=1 Tax=Novosphingobium aromaticivorans (strain ATCC 700278 / DSM 12444 / CCUG 56034 / CIP 105152 / NBRC 16084 / F199) TaxID=279238 RepID=TATB_NOVAD|nr:Sec-independent protein translocase protein TatB [Novosphingobium aromaticivorans]Q2G9D3.1 RecName: Full=Sec-independent protein translocase protein TatB [Novosphingobium aromaticivorans DSM 12444]ABD25540.1 twin-arginine translocation protein TatB [Novosphingobium aromaticivorans DSM 12444]SCX96720.1 sec-independent protein translocase protein TatB [Novosphingobium aromaticivorans]